MPKYVKYDPKSEEKITLDKSLNPPYPPKEKKPENKEKK